MMKIQRILDRLCSLSSRRNKGFGPFPDDIMINILSWLPANDVLRCRIVCKRWRTLTTSSYFILVQSQSASSANLVQGDPLRTYDHLPIALNKEEKEWLDSLVKRRSAVKEGEEKLEEKGQQMLSDFIKHTSGFAVAHIVISTSILSQCRSFTGNQCCMAFFILFAIFVIMNWWHTKLRSLDKTPTRKGLFEEPSSPHLFFWDQLWFLEAPMEFKQREVFFMRRQKQLLAMSIIAFGVIDCTAGFLCKKKAITDGMLLALNCLNMLLGLGLTIYSIIRDGYFIVARADLERLWVIVTRRGGLQPDYNLEDLFNDM